MSNLKVNSNEEIDLLKFFYIIWIGKWIVILFATTFFILVFSYQQIKPNNNFTSITLIKPLTSYQFQEYWTYNTKFKKLENFFLKYNNILNYGKITVIPKNQGKSITRKFLISAFLEEADEQSLFEETIKKYNLIKKENYNNEDDFNEAVSKLSSKLKIVIARDEFKFEKQSINSYSLIFDFHDIKIWKKALIFLVGQINENVKKSLVNQHEVILNNAKDFKAEKINQLNNAIQNEILKYDYAIKKQLIYLQEQASIARRVGIKVDKKSQIISLQNNVQSENQYPLYYRGYEALEEEIRLVRNRLNKKTFIPLIQTLENEINNIKNDNTIKDFEKSFFNSPLNDKNFKAVIIKLANTELIYHKRDKLFLILSLLAGIVIGSIFVILKDALTNRKEL